MEAEAVERRLPAEWRGIVPAEIFVKEALTLVDKAQKMGVVLRAMGAVAIGIHCKGLEDLSLRLGRMGGGQLYTDLDFMGYLRQRKQIAEAFSAMGYAKRKPTLSAAASQRQIFFHPEGWFTVDVLMDKLLIANHPLDFRRRLELDYPTLTASDLLLEKIQMWEAFSAKDLKDVILLLRAHTMELGAEDSIDSAYIAGLLSRNWGFYYTATTNLRQLVSALEHLDELGQRVGIDPSALTKEERMIVAEKAKQLLDKVGQAPKTLRWRLRSVTGKRVKWYNHVETPESVGGFGLWRMREVFPK